MIGIVFWQNLWMTIVSWWRPVLKGILRRATGLCELQRICYGEIPGAPRALAVEQSLRSTRAPAVNAMIERLDSIADNARLHVEIEAQILSRVSQIVMRQKHINPRIHQTFAPCFERNVQLIWGYRQLYSIVERLRTSPYDTEISNHEDKLLELWKLLMPNEALEGRITKQWQDIGFQGDDPKTDFRGMGLLGLENLLYFAKEYPGPAGHVLSHSHHPKYGYTFAVVGINLTSMAYNLLKDGSAKTYVYNISKGLPTIEIFHKLYCYLFYEFDRFWIESKPRNMMEFSPIQQTFEKGIRNALKNKSAKFKMNIKIENI